MLSSARSRGTANGIAALLSSMTKRPRSAGDDLTAHKLQRKHFATVVYCDGACKGNGTKNALAGIGVFFGDGDRRNISDALPLDLSPQTNQRAELYAAYRALQAVCEGEEIEIRTDSMYTIKCLTEWIHAWRRNNWKDGKVMNRDLISSLDGLLTSRSGGVKWVHVRGHSGEYGNEAADKLAVAGISKHGTGSAPVTLTPQPVLDGHSVSTAIAVDDVDARTEVVDDRAVLDALPASSCSVAADERRPAGRFVVELAATCSQSGTEHALSAYGIVMGGSILGDAIRNTDRHTSQRSELYGVWRALEFTADRGPIEIRSSSKYVIQAMTEWMEKWKQQSWQCNIRNADIFQEIDALLQRRTSEVHWIHVSKENKIAKKVAKLAIAAAVSARDATEPDVSDTASE